jgi:hypothetical protein
VTSRLLSGFVGGWIAEIHAMRFDLGDLPVDALEKLAALGLAQRDIRHAGQLARPRIVGLWRRSGVDPGAHGAEIVIRGRRRVKPLLVGGRRLRGVWVGWKVLAGSVELRAECLQLRVEFDDLPIGDFVRKEGVSLFEDDQPADEICFVVLEVFDMRRGLFGLRTRRGLVLVCGVERPTHRGRRMVR